MSSNRVLLVAAAASVLAACGSSGDGARSTAVLYGVTHGASRLLELDPDRGAPIRVVGSVGYQVNGLEWDHVTGKLLATTSTLDPNFPSGLLEIDPATGAGTPIGSGAGEIVMTPTVDSAGRLFAWSRGPSGDRLASIDEATGVATVVGAPSLTSFEHGLAFDGQDRLVLVNEDGGIFLVDPATGAATPAGSIGVRAHHGDFHPDTGRYWGIDETANSSTGHARRLRVVDVPSATVVATLATADDLFAITFRDTE